MDTYIITAKTVEEAISSAKKQYEDENHEVSYEILEMPKKGLFGIGAKDAKVKITVSKTEKVELGSLVAEMRSMRNLTDRSGDSEKSARKPEQNQPKQPKPQQNPPKEPKPQNPQPKQPKPQNPQNPQKEQKQQPKPQQPKAPLNASANANPESRQPKQPKEQQPKPPKPQQPKGPKENRPADKPIQPKPAEKPVKQEKPTQPVQQPVQPAQPKPVQQPEKQEKPVQTEEAEASRLDQAILSTTTANTKFGDADAEYKTSLHNSSRPNRRAPQKHGSNPEEKIDAGAVTVSQPMGLTDFVADPSAQGFGKNNGSSANANAGRMNNDVRKKKNAPKTAGDKKPESAAPRYDFAESDDDYEKLDRLVSEAESELEAAEAAVLVPKPTTVTEEPEEDDSDAEELSPVRESRRREAITQTEMDYALEFANTLLANMKLSARAVAAECPEGEEFDTTEEATVYPKIDVVGDDTGILIGHHGETLDSIQYLVNLSALRKTRSRDGDYVKIVVDIENYREKREDTLRTLARRMAARAVKYKRNVFLEPMNAYERRIIHSELQNFENVSTHSVGADRDRKIIITYEGPDKQPDNRQNGGRRRRGDKAPAEESGAGTNANAGAENGAAKENGGNGNGSGRNRRRPRKSQKMPIEKLDELLPGGDESAAVTEAAEAIEAVEAAAEPVISEAAESAQSDEE